MSSTRRRGEADPWQIVPEMLRQQYEAGDVLGLLAAVNWHLSEAPDWVKDAFGTAYRRYWNGEVGTLDDAFGVARKKRAHSKAALKQRSIGLRVATYVLWHEKTVGNEQALEDAARQFGIGKTTIRKHCKAHRIRIEKHLADLAMRPARERAAFEAHLMETEPDPRKRVAAIRLYDRGNRTP